jgi:hypothetical protein
MPVPQTERQKKVEALAISWGGETLARSSSLSMPMAILRGRQRKRGITLLQNASMDFIRVGCGTRAL